MLRIKAWKAEMRHLIGDYRCIICARGCSAEPSFCGGCEAILPWLSADVCLMCGAFSPGGCIACKAREDPFQHRLAVFDYAFPIDALLKHFKYQEKRTIGRNLGFFLAQAARKQERADGIDLLLPVPIARSRRRQRGFNQAADIAEACGQLLNIPTSDQWLHRHADTPMLAGLSPVERRFALLGAFTARDAVVNKHVALVDDVMTSGATCLELNRELRDRGAASVSVWTLARTTTLIDFD